MFLDDIHDPPLSREWIIVRSFDEAVNHVMINGVPKLISFDHDLGDNVPTGFDLAKWLVESHLDGTHIIPSDFSYTVHSANPVGKENIEGLLDPFLKFIYDS